MANGPVVVDPYELTLEELLTYGIRKRHQLVEREFQKEISHFHAQLEEMKEALWKAHNANRQEPCVISDSEESNTGGNANKRSKVDAHGKNDKEFKEMECDTNPPVESNQTVKNEKNANTGNKKASGKPNGLRIKVTEGPYNGEVFNLNPRPRAHCYIGRSSGKRFRERGISLQNDTEVSTEHAKIEVKKGVYYFVDTGSTNGTVIDGIDIEPCAPYELKDGTVVALGSTVLVVEFL